MNKSAILAASSSLQAAVLMPTKTAMQATVLRTDSLTISWKRRRFMRIPISAAKRLIRTKRI